MLTDAERNLPRLAEQYLDRCDELETVSIPQLRRRLATGDVVLIDVRPELEYRAGTFQARYPFRWKAHNRPAHAAAET